MDWQIVVAISALAVGILGGMLSKLFDKSLSREEHKEFKDAIRVELDRLRADLRNEIERMRLQRERDLDNLLERIKTLEGTRPTTGEIEARLDRRATGKNG